MKTLSLVGGSRGLGFALLQQLKDHYDLIHLFDIENPIEKETNTHFHKFDLSKDNVLSISKYICSSDDLIITAGVGQVKPFIDCSVSEIKNLFLINTISNIQIVRLFFENLLCKKDCHCLFMGSIAGEVCSPLFATYGASKASIYQLCESLNIELEKKGSSNRITYVSATSFDGTSFNGKDTDLSKIAPVAVECICAMKNKETKHYINPELCKDVISRYNKDSHSFGLSSYEYKMKSGRISHKKQVIGYLSGTFDLFHIGHLNILRRAKAECDYLIVGVHEDGSWKGKETFIPFEERLEIIRSVKYVDEADKSLKEDSEAWNKYHFDKLFVGSDYKGSERFKKYEEFFKDKGVQIVYFPYTKGTSSSQLREKLVTK